MVILPWKAQTPAHAKLQIGNNKSHFCRVSSAMIRYNTQENTILTALGLLTRFCVSTVIALGFLSVDVMVFPHYRLLSCFKGSPLTRKIISMPVLTDVGLSGVL